VSIHRAGRVIRSGGAAPSSTIPAALGARGSARRWRAPRPRRPRRRDLHGGPEGNARAAPASAGGDAEQSLEGRGSHCRVGARSLAVSPGLPGGIFPFFKAVMYSSWQIACRAMSPGQYSPQRVCTAAFTAPSETVTKPIRSCSAKHCWCWYSAIGVPSQPQPQWWHREITCDPGCTCHLFITAQPDSAAAIAAPASSLLIRPPRRSSAQPSTDGFQSRL